jgi:hypothetical protein
MFETSYNASEFEGLMDFNATCRRTRGKYLRTASFMISNHFATSAPLDLPDISIAEQANLAKNIRNRTDACTAMLNRTTNLLAVDFWSVGDTLAVVKEYNSLLPDMTQAPSMSRSPSASPTGSTSNIESNADPTFAPGSESSFVPSGALQVDSTNTPASIIVSTPEPSFDELSASNAPTSSLSYGESQNVSLNDYT